MNTLTSLNHWTLSDGCFSSLRSQPSTLEFLRKFEDIISLCLWLYKLNTWQVDILNFCIITQCIRQRESPFNRMNCLNDLRSPILLAIKKSKNYTTFIVFLNRQCICKLKKSKKKKKWIFRIFNFNSQIHCLFKNKIKVL